MKSFTYVYHSNYGCPETDTRAEAVKGVKISDDGKSAMLTIPGLNRGRVYDFHLDGITTADGEQLLHADAYYTLNELNKSE